MISRRALLAGAAGLIASPALAFPVIDAPPPRRLPDILKRAGLWNDAAYALDASDPASFSTGQTWSDLTPNKRNFLRGANSSASTDDPTLVDGAPFTTGRRFSLDGSDFFTISANGTFVNSLHKDNSSTTLWMYGQFPNFAANAILWGTARLTSDVGIRHIIGTSGQLSIGVNNGGGTFQALLASAITATAGVPTFISVAVNEAGGATASHARIDHRTETFNGAITSPSASNASNSLTIGANSAGTQTFPNGTRLFMHGAFTRALSIAETQRLRESIERAR